MIAHPPVYIFFTLGISGTLGYRISIGENENLPTTLLRHAYLIQNRLSEQIANAIHEYETDVFFREETIQNGLKKMVFRSFPIFCLNENLIHVVLFKFHIRPTYQSTRYQLTV